MKLSAECVPCLLRRAAYEVELCAPGRSMDALIECASVVRERADPRISSAEFASAIHKCAYGAIGRGDPYFELKRRSNAVAKRLLPFAKKFVAESKDPLATAMRVSIIGNLLDFGIKGSIGSPEELQRSFRSLLDEPLDRDDTKEIEGILRTAKRMVFLADNCGEIVFDTLLLKEIKKLGKNHITLVIKGEPILTDVTSKDMKGLGIERLVNGILETDDAAVGINLWDKDKNVEIVKKMKGADLIISKGMANFEALSERSWKAVAYLLRVKCDTVAQAIDAPVDSNVIRLSRGKLKR